MKWWNDYWFRPAPYVDLAMLRIFAVGCQVLLLWFFFRYNEANFAMLASLPEPMYNPITLLRLFLLPFGAGYRPSAEFMQIIYYITLLSGVCSLVGFRTNVSLLIFALGNAFMVSYNYSHGDFHHTEAPLVIALGVLALSPAGRVLSVDAWIRHHRDPGADTAQTLTAESAFAGWPIRVVQWLFVLMYLSAVLSKLVFEGGLDWLNGYTLQYYMVQDTLRKGTLLGGWFAQHHTLIMLSQYAVVIFQATFVAAVLFPRLRWIYVPLGLGFHAANWILLQAPFPEWMALYAVFIPWRSCFALLSRRADVLRRDRRVTT
jgi:hypothetical protein